jgi:hypothetical protein
MASDRVVGTSSNAQELRISVRFDNESFLECSDENSALTRRPINAVSSASQTKSGGLELSFNCEKQLLMAIASCLFAASLKSLFTDQ